MAKRGDRESGSASHLTSAKLAPSSSAIVAVVPEVWVDQYEHELGKHSDDVSVQVLDRELATQLDIDVGEVDVGEKDGDEMDEG